MLRVVLDTNIIVSGTVASSGPPYEILEAWRNRKFRLATSNAIVDEVEKVLGYPKIKNAYDLEEKTIKLVIQSIKGYSIITPGKATVNAITDDSTDNIFLVCAKEAEADSIVSGDKHLLDLRTYEGIPIVMPRRFLEHLKQVTGYRDG